MAKFLNTETTVFWLNELIRTAESELIIIVPYIKTSSAIFQSLSAADKRGVDITLVYREDKLSVKEKNKLINLTNLNLLHHPNIHAKCYFNGDLLLVGSMNLYEFSEKNNREMGILMHRCAIEGAELKPGWDGDDDTEFAKAKEEIRAIINGSTIEKLNNCKHNGSFEIKQLKTEEEFAQERCNIRNRYFLNKRFTPLKLAENSWGECCRNYYDRIDVSFEGHRVSFDFKHPDVDMEELHTLWMRTYDEYEFRGFKYYWNYFSSSVYLYLDRTFDWDDLIENDKAKYHQKLKEGIDSIIAKYRQLSGR